MNRKEQSISFKIGQDLETSTQTTADAFVAGVDNRADFEPKNYSSPHEAVFKVTDVIDCPNFRKGDTIKASGYALSLQPKKGNQFIANIVVKYPAQRTACRTLIAELAKILINHERVSLIPDMAISCGQCQGAITLEYKKPTDIGLVEDFEKYSKDIDTIVSLLKNFSIFKRLDENNLKNFVTLFRLKKYNSNTCIIRQGDPGSNLFIILSGLVEVLAVDGTRIATLGDGEVFGEMSLISGGPAGATVAVLEPAIVLFIKGQDFLHALKNYPSLQMYFARLISRRLSDLSEIASIDLISKTSGRLDRMSPLTLVQSINCRQMTGVLKLTFQKGFASLAFREGKIVEADYNAMKGKQAFFLILGEKEGRFIFTPGLSEQQMLLPELGMFIELLFEGLRIINKN